MPQVIVVSVVAATKHAGSTALHRSNSGQQKITYLVTKCIKVCLICKLNHTPHTVASDGQVHGSFSLGRQHHDLLSRMPAVHTQGVQHPAFMSNVCFGVPLQHVCEMQYSARYHTKQPYI